MIEAPVSTPPQAYMDIISPLIDKARGFLEADFVFTIMEAWSLRPDKVPQMDAILDKYGSIGASPYAVDVCPLMLETRRGMWVAQPQIKPKGISKKKRTIGAVEFRYYTEAEGRRRTANDFALRSPFATGGCFWSPTQA